MDPFNALNVACAVVQFVGFAARILKQGYDKYRSTDGAASGDFNTEQLVKELRKINHDLLAFDTTAQDRALTQDEKGLEEVVRRCQAKADELLELLQSLHAQGSALQRTRSAMWQAFKREWKASRIEKLQRELDQIQQQVNTVLLELLRSGQSSVASTLDDLKQKNDRMEINAGNLIYDLRDQLVHSIQGYQREITHGIKDILRSIRALDEATLILDKIQLILKSLQFPKMHDRHHRIPTAHAGTFDWILDKEKTNFPAWLTAKTDVFWITGKPGSGKSTLMKYIESHKDVLGMLESWANHDDKSLITASFYFWYSGTPLQRSQEGMLRSLLFQVLRKSPRIIPDVLPGAWSRSTSSLATDGMTWTYEALIAAFKALASLAKPDTPYKYCLFVDGLDEHCAPTDLTPTLEQVMRCDHIKLCLASRPWPEFRSMYADPKRMLVMQEYTRPDIDVFVKALLKDEPLFRQRAQHDQRANELVEAVIDKAQGVFLWVFLVTNSLKRGLRYGDDFATLERRLQAMPSDLKSFFARMLDCIEEVYRKPAAMLLLTALETHYLPLITFRYLPLEVETHDAVLYHSAVTLRDDEEQATDMIAQAQRYIDTCCRDLLELHYCDNDEPYEWLGVSANFTHRTVGEYLSQREVQESLVSHLVVDKSFHASRFMTQALIYQAKSVPLEHARTSQCHLLLDTARRATEHARRYEQATGISSWPLMQELGRIDNHELFKASKKSQEGWVHRLTPRLYFSVVLIRAGLVLAVRDMMNDEKSHLTVEDSRELLISLFHNGNRNGPCINFHEMARTLVRCHLDFNRRPKTRPIVLFNAWEVFLLCCQGSTDNYNPRWWSMARLMLELGADPWTTVVGSDYDYLFTKKWPAQRTNVLSVRTCLRSACNTQEKEELEKVLDSVERKHQWSFSHLQYLVKRYTTTVPLISIVLGTTLVCVFIQSCV